MDLSIYDRLLTLPLFQGLSKTDFEDVLAKVRFDFSTVSDGETFIHCGDACDSFVFLLNGEIVSARHSSDSKLLFRETILETLMLEPYSMFGLTPVFTKDYTAIGNAGLLRVSKQYLYSELYKYSVCRMNLLNMLCGRIQATEAEKWNLRALSLRERIVNTVSGLSDYQTGPKEVRVRMEDFAGILGETRLNVSKTLNELSKEGKIVLRRGGFDVPSLENLK